MSVDAAIAPRSVGARRALGLFCGALCLFGLTRQGHSAESVDVRTYIEMMRGVAEHGLPYLDNGPADRLTVLRAPWNIAMNGHFWGIYGPLYPYLAAPFLLVGGLRLVSVATFMLTSATALVTFLLARRFLRDEWYATASAISSVAATPLIAKSVELTAYPLAVVFAAASTYAILVAVGERGRKRIQASAVAGVVCAFATSSHLLCFPMSVALIGALALCDTSDASDHRGPAWLARTPLAGFRPTRATVLSAGVAGATMALFTMPVAFLNHRRFGTWNPFTYGPTPWRGSDENGVVDQTIGGHLRYAAPVLGVVLVAALVVFIVRALRPGRVLPLVLGAVCCTPLAVVPILRVRAFAFARTAFAYVVDQSLVTLEPPYTRLPTGFGHLSGGWLVKSTLQCTPLLLLVLALPKLEAKKRQETFVLLAPCVALFGYLALRANLPLHSALGFPWVYIRYTLPGLPMLLTVAFSVARETAPAQRDWIVAGVTALVAGGWGLFVGNDEPIIEQTILLILPLVAAVAAVVAVLAHRRGILRPAIAAFLVAVAGGVGIGTSSFHDLHANLIGKVWCDHRNDVMAKIAPQRFALLGYLLPMEPALALRSERDVEYGDLYQVADWQLAKPAIDHWFADARPIFFLTDVLDVNAPVSPWAGYAIETVDEREHIYRIVRQGAPL